EIRLEDRLDYHLRRHLHHAISYRRNAQWTLFPVSFRNQAPTYRVRSVLACSQISSDFVEPLLRSTLFDGLDAFTIDARCACVAASSHPRLPQDVTPVDPVVQRVEAPCPAPLGRHVQSALQLSHFIHGGFGSHDHALALTCRSDATEVGALPSST